MLVNVVSVPRAYKLVILSVATCEAPMKLRCLSVLLCIYPLLGLRVCSRCYTALQCDETQQLLPW